MAGGVLRTRLRPPRVPARAIARPRLIRLGEAGLDGGRLLVVAPAGYGKSTFLAQLAASREEPVAWCSCDTRMGDARLLLAHVAAAVGEVHPGVGAGLSLGADLDEAVTSVANELDATVSDSLALILDDVHLLAGTDGERALAALLDALPGTIAVALGGRAAPAIPLSTLRARGLVDIGAAELAFDDAEATALLAGVVPSPEDIELTQRITEGWPAGLVVAAHAGLSSRSDLGALEPEQLFSHLADEILDRLDEREAEVIEASACVSRFTPEMTAVLTGYGDAPEICRRLLRGEMLVVELGSGWFRYHHLLQAHLRRRLQTWTPERRSRLEHAAGEAWLGMGEHLEAARHFLLAEEPERAAQVLSEVAEKVARGPEGAELGALLERLPEHVRGARPGLVLAFGAAQYSMGRHEEGFALAEEAIERLIELDEHERAAKTLTFHVMAMTTAGAPPARRVEAGERFLPRIRPSPARAVFESFHAAGLAGDREPERALAALASARAAARPGGPPIDLYADLVEGYCSDIPEGRFTVGVEKLERAYEELGRSDDPLAPDFRIFSIAFLIFWLNHRGRYREALDWVERGFALARRVGLEAAAVRASWWWKMVALAGLEQFDDLAIVLKEAERREAHRSHFGYRQRAPAALLAAHRGDAAAVVEELDAALRHMSAHVAAFDHAWVFCDLSTALAQVGLGTRAADLARMALAVAEEIGMPWDVGRARIRLALSADGDEARHALASVLVRSADGGLDELWTRRERAGAGVLLARSLVEQVGPEDVALRLSVACGGEVQEEVLRRCHEAPTAARERLITALTTAGAVPDEVRGELLRDASPQIRRTVRKAAAAGRSARRPPISIAGFGGLVVERAGVPVPRRAFGRDKARQLLAALLAARGPVHRDLILEWLWPDLPPDRGARAFHVTLHGLRKALEPDLPRRAVGSLVSAEGETYRVALEDEDHFDIAAFLELADPARARDESDLDARLGRALLLRRGDPFPEWPYAPWAESLRADIDRAARLVRSELARLALEAGRPRDAAEHLEALVALEPEREEHHRALMSAYAAAGERALALRQFHAARTVLRRELALDVGPETRALYTAILRSDDGAVAPTGVA